MCDIKARGIHTNLITGRCLIPKDINYLEHVTSTCNKEMNLMNIIWAYYIQFFTTTTERGLNTTLNPTSVWYIRNCLDIGEMGLFRHPDP